MIDNAAWVWASFAFSRGFSARNRSVSVLPASPAAAADVFPDRFADPATRRCRGLCPFPDVGMEQALPPQDRGLLAVRGRLVLGHDRAL